MKNVDKNNTQILTHSLSDLFLEDTVFAQVFSNNLAIMLLVEPNEKQSILEANEAARRFYGYNRDQFLQLKMGDINTLPLEERQKRMKDVMGKPNSHYLFIHKTSSGVLKNVEVTASPITVKNKKVMFIIVHDITVQKRVESQLRENQERLSLALEGSNLGLWDWYLKTGELHVNERWAEMLGYSLDEIYPLTHDKWMSLSNPEDLEERNLRFKKYIDHEVDTYKCALRMKHKNGDWIWVQTQGKVFEWDSNGRPLRMAGTHLDITERKLIEMKLSASEQRYKSFFDNSPLSLWEHDYTDVISYMDGLIDSNAMDIQILLDNHPEIVKKCVDLVKILDVNPATLKLYNAQCKEDLLRNLSRVFTGQSYKTFKNVLVQIYKRGPVPSRESTNKVLNGKTINVLIESALLSENRYINTVTDITQQKLLETKLTESEQKFRSYFENSPLSLWEEDHTDVVKYLQSLPVSGEVELITYLDKNPEAVKKCMGLVKLLNMNQSTLDLYEADSTEMMLNNFSKIFTSSTYESFKAELIFLYKHESYFADQFTDQTLIGRRIDLKFEMRLLSDYRYIVTITNITELKNNEYRLQELLSQTRAASETKEILLREINHRVKNNLSSLIGILYAEKKKSKNTLEKKQTDLLNNLINRVKGISIAHDLLSRSEWKPISIGFLSEKIINSLKHLIPSDRYIKTDNSQSSVFIDADQSQSMAIIINELFVNSLEHASLPGGTLKVDIKIIEKEGTVSYIYRDNGPGFSKEILALNSFNVGLYLIKNIVEKSLRGTISLKNKNGALIEIQFPGGGQIAEI